MKNLIYFLLGAILLSACNSAADSTGPLISGADEYGMKPYVLCLLEKGPHRDQDSLTADSIQKGHLRNIERLSRSGKIALAGPLLMDTTLRGIFIYDVSTVAEAEKLLQSDPAVKAGRLIGKLYPWYGPATLTYIDSLQQQFPFPR